MGIERLEDNLNIHQSLPNQPTLEAQELKKEFDRPANIIKDFINDILLPKLDEIDGRETLPEGEVYTFLKRIVAQGGIEGDVKGDLDGNAKTATTASSCTGNSATATTANSASVCTRQCNNCYYCK